MWYFFRHGYTIHNKYKISQGRYNSCLSLDGIKQSEIYANKILNEVKNLDEYIFLSSPMFRAKQTINIICEILNINPFEKLREEELLIDIDFGDYNNTPNSIVWRSYVEEGFLSCSHPNGEGFFNVYKRMEQFIEKYKNINNLIISTHGCCFSFLTHILSGNTEESFVRSNLSKNQNCIIGYDPVDKSIRIL